MTKTVNMVSTLQLIAGVLILSHWFRTCTAAEHQHANLSDMMWKSTEEERSRVINSAFIKHIGDGTLDPTAFGVFGLQNAVYCKRTAESLIIASSRTTDSELRETLEAESEGFGGYGEHQLSNTWHILHDAAISLDDATTQRIANGRNVSETMEPIYSLVMMAQTVRLWSWIGTQIDFTKCGVYQSSAEGFFRPSKRYESLENIINKWDIAGKLDGDRAKEVYKRFMGLESAVFEEAAAFKNTSAPTTPRCTVSISSAPCGSSVIITGQIVFIYIWLMIQINPGDQP